MLLNCGAGEDSWESLDSKEIKAVSPEGSQPWVFIGRDDAEAEAPIFWPPDVTSWLVGKHPDAWEEWRQKEKRAGWDGWIASLIQWTWTWWTLGNGEGLEGLACCHAWWHVELDITATEQQQLVRWQSCYLSTTCYFIFSITLCHDITTVLQLRKLISREFE